MTNNGKKQKKSLANKEKIAEDWCFVCKDGGHLIICDFQRCLKSYHPACVEKDDSYFESETHWNCAWHTCFICNKSSDLHCYTCTSAVCSRTRCLRRAEIFPIKGQYGFCQPCLKLALLIEDRKGYDSDGEMVDFEDLETFEGLFSEYYDIIKKEEGFEPQNLYAAKEGVKATKIPECSSEDNYEEENEISDYDGAKHAKKYRSGRKKSRMQIPMKLSKNDFVGWGSRALIDFLSSIGISDVCKKQRKLNTERKSPEKELADDVPLGCFASIVVENVKLVYLRRSLLLELLKQPELFAEKVVGCFIRVKSDPYHSRNSHQLMQVRGVKRLQICENIMEAEAILLISATPEEISTSQLSDDDFTEEECEDLRRKVLAGQLERPTVEDLQQKANILHEDLTKHWITKELPLLQNLIDRANEKGWRRELFEYLEKKRRLQTPSEVSKLIENVPKVIPDRHEHHPISDDNLNDISIDKDSPKSILRCNSSVTMQDGKESEEKTRRHRNASTPARKQSIFIGSDSEPEEDDIAIRKVAQSTAEPIKDKLEGEESGMCSHKTMPATRSSGHMAAGTAVIEVISDDESSDD
ncbi:hypothetical protein AAHA92_31045 [Salvia divinorum]|uniref:Plus3 domain-containing protein n=1 Tax=Salvia divinorum TaxID=28513 RepID=A0ABD1FTF8_SALDI